jgi:uncharacterized membrane protein YgcG
VPSPAALKAAASPPAPQLDRALTDAEKALNEQRIQDLEADPHTSVAWEEAKLRLMAPFKR